MNRKNSTLLSLGISMALIAGAIWFLFDHHSGFGYGGYGRWSMPHQAIMGGGGFGIFMILFWVVVIGAIVMVVSGIAGGGRVADRDDPQRPPDAMEILDRRYASGEIDKTQYQAMKKELKQP